MKMFYQIECFFGRIIQKNIKIKILSFLIAFIVLPNLYSEPAETSTWQGITITGVVTDKSGPLPGVNVIIKGTPLGVVTDLNGKFSIAVPNREAVLSFSFVGYITQESIVGDRNIIDVTLEEDTHELEEIVVVGYGTMKKSDLTGSVQRLKAEKLEMQSNTQVTDMLAGTIAGFNANQSYSAAGGSSMEIRGPTSLSASNTPLVVVDGSIYYGTLSDINPADIETIDVLKDASSAAVYGAKAASGVVLITTKKGKTGKPTINASAKIGLAQPQHSVKPYDAKGYPTFRRDVLNQWDYRNNQYPDYYYHNPDDLPSNISVNEWMNYSANPNADPTVEYLNRLKFTPLEQQKYLAGESVDWYKEMIVNALRQDYTLSISGGTDRLSYYYSLGYLNNEGIIRGDAFATVRSRLNVDFAITDWLNAGVNTQFANRDQSAVPVSISPQISPYAEIFNADGTVAWYPHGYSVNNPLVNYYEQEKSDITNDLFTRMFLKLTLPFGITYELAYQPRFSYRSNLNFWNSNTITGGSTYKGGYGTREETKIQEWNLDNLIQWNKEFGVHKFFVTLLYNSRKSQQWYTKDTNVSFSPNENLGFNGLQFGSSPTILNNDGYETGDAMMGRINYNLMDKYLVTASIRRDGYSAFGQENPRAVFPAAALAWVVSNEHFYNSDWFLNRLKLRFSWGVNGNSDVGRYAALAQLGSYMYSDGSALKIGVYNSTLANRNLKWERTEAINFGFDIGLFNNRIDITADFYNMNTTNLLMKRQLPIITGYTEVMSNLGKTGNQGIEITINTTNMVRENFSWNSNFLFSMNRNKIKHLFGDYEEVVIDGQTIRREVNDYTNKWFIDQPIDVVWDYDMIGIWQMEEAEEAAKYKLVPGDMKAHDVDGNHIFEALADKKFIGYTQPRFRIGTTQSVTFLKNFTASVFLRADLGHIGPFSHALRPQYEMYDRMNTWDTPYWTPENRNNDYPGLMGIWQNQYGGGVKIYKSRSFLRIQDFSIAYTLPSEITKRLGLNNLRVFGSIRNLYTFTKWPGFDPETIISSSEKLETSTASGTTAPMPRIFTFGVDISL